MRSSSASERAVSISATVTALRDAVYFPAHQDPRAIAMLAIWATALFAAMIAVSYHRGASPGIS